MRTLLVILITILSIGLGQAQNEIDSTKESVKVFSELGSRSYADASRVLHRLGNYSPVMDVFTKVSYKNAYVWVFSSVDIGFSEVKNPGANYLQFTGGYVLEFGKWSFDVNLSTYLGGVGEDYLKLDFDKRLFIPNVYTKYAIDKKRSIGLWTNYFDSPDGSALMMRVDYSISTKIGDIKFVSAYAGGPFGKDKVINGGVIYSGKLATISETLSLHGQFNLYKVFYAFGDNPFTTNTMGGGVMLRYVL